MSINDYIALKLIKFEEKYFKIMGYNKWMKE